MKTIAEWKEYLKDAPDYVKEVSLYYWSRLYIRYNKGSRVLKQELKELSNFMMAAYLLGINKKEFINYSKKELL